MPFLQFKGKSFVQNHHLAVPYHQLVPQKDKSLTNKVSLHDNLVVQGDNLLALKALLPTYASKVKCIYIDPPYNTGNEQWKYNDKVNSPLIKEWIGKTVGKEGEDFTRHDKWLCMMMPRLKLLKELLSDEGAIFISIDDNELNSLRLICDEIFGEANYVSTVVWQKKVSPSNDAQWFSYDHEYVLVYAKDKSKWRPIRLKRSEEQMKYYTNPDKDPRGDWNSATYTSNKTKEQRPNLYYGIINPNTGEEVFPSERAVWAYSKEQYAIHANDNRLYWGKDGKSKQPRYKLFLYEAKDIVPRTVWSYTDVGSTQSATQQLRDVMPDVQFETPKPVSLIKKILQIGSDDTGLILDSFAGSGTTAQAVLELNKEDGGSRKFVLVEMEDYADRITAERVRSVITGVPSSKNDLVKNGLGGTFSYFSLGDPIETVGILNGSKLPIYLELARYIYYTATGEEFDETKLDETKNFVGSSSHYDVYMLYRPDIEYLKQTALTLNMARELREQAGSRPLLVFAPTKYVESGELDELKIDFCQLPFEIYKIGK